MLKYRKLLFNKKYEEFGMQHAPRVTLAGILALVLIVILIHDIFKPISGFFQGLYHINFDIFTLLSGFRFMQ
jgi:general stress protein CsbA